MSTTESPNLATVTEAAKAWRVHKVTVIRWCQQHKLPAFQLPSGQWRIELPASRPQEDTDE